MEEEIVKRPNPNRVAAMNRARAAKQAKQAKAPEPVERQHKQVDDEAEAAGRGGSRLQSKNGRVEVMGRNGEVLSRSSTYVSDSFEIPKHLWPKGWSYQWNTLSVHGNTEVVRDHMNLMQQQGWRAVPAERYAGTLLPRGAKGAMVRGGMVLEERPETLTEEATREDVANARKLISDRNESLKLAGVKKSMPEGFEMNSGQYKGTGGDVKISIDHGLDAPPPSYTLAKPGE